MTRVSVVWQTSNTNLFLLYTDFKVLLFSARRCILQQWISDSVPTVSHWIWSIMELLPLEAISFWLFQIWDPLLDYIGDDGARPLSGVVSVAWHRLMFQDAFLDLDVLLVYCCVWFPLVLWLCKTVFCFVLFCFVLFCFVLFCFVCVESKFCKNKKNRIETIFVRDVSICRHLCSCVSCCTDKARNK